jgi:drug/metabolite transporter (DMT)-like permease
MTSSSVEDRSGVETRGGQAGEKHHAASTPGPARHDAQALLLGPGAMLLSSVVFAMMGVLVKSVDREGVPAAESTFVRFAAGLALVGLLARSGVVRVTFQRRRLLLVRGLFGSVSAVLFFQSLGLTSLARATLLSYTYVIFSALFSAIWLRERLGPGSLLALAVAIGGIAMVTGARFTMVNSGDLVALLSGLLGGIAITSIRELRKTESASSIFAAFCAAGMVTSLLMSRGAWLIPRGSTLAALGGVALLATGGQLLMTAAYRYCSSALGGLLSLLTVVLAALAGFAFFHEAVTIRTAIGAALVLGPASYLTVAEARSPGPMD